MPENLQHFAPILTHGLLAFFGALVHASKAYRAGQTKGILDYLALVMMSSFSGVMFFLLTIYLFGEPSYLTMAMAGTGGFLGVEGMTIIINRLQSIISSK